MSKQWAFTDGEWGLLSVSRQSELSFPESTGEEKEGNEDRRVKEQEREGRIRKKTIRRRVGKAESDGRSPPPVL